jgi:hypothetical protein
LLRPRTFILYDRTAVTDPSLDQWLAFHLGGRALTSGPDRYDVIGHGGYAGSVDTVLPAGHRDEIASWFGSGKVARLEIRPPRPASAYQWLTVFDAAPSAAQAADATPLPATGEPAGVLLRRAGGNEAVLLGGNEPREVRYRAVSGPTTNVLIGLRPRTSYTVRTSGGQVDVRPGPGPRASAAGVLSFRTG